MRPVFLLCPSRRILLAAVLLAMPLACSCATAQTAPRASQPAAPSLPKGTLPKKLFRISHNRLGNPELIALTSLQGILAKNNSENIYLDDGAAGYRLWLDTFQREHNVEVTDAASFRALLTHFAPNVIGYILCDTASQRSLAIAATLAGPARAVMIDTPLQPLATELGLKQLHDTRVKDYAWLDQTLAALPKYAPAPLVISQPPGQLWQSRDYAILANAQVVPMPDTKDGNDPDVVRLRDLCARTPAPATLLGWSNQETEDEGQFVSRLSLLGLAVIPGDHARNLAILSAIPAPAAGLKQKARQVEPSANPKSAIQNPKSKKHTVTFVLSDGDNLSWLLFDCPVNERWFASPERGRVPLGWGMAPAALELAPGMMRWYYDNAVAGKDQFIVGPSGNGYLYPSLMPRDALERHAAELNRLMGQSDLRLAQIIDNNALDNTALWRAYLSQPHIDGLIYFDYAPYDKYRGRITWAAGKPVVSAAMQYWGAGDHASTPRKKVPRNSAEGIVSVLNAAPRDPYSEKGYSLVVVHVWTHTAAEVAALAARIDADRVDVVTPGEFFRRIQQNLAPKTPTPISQ